VFGADGFISTRRFLTVEQFFTQTDWQGIQFSDLGVPLDPGTPAGPVFL
jgi:hypothetical protein